jgi:phospho-N-acetylmuramoyl-pentapeptide-transferase
MASALMPLAMALLGFGALIPWGGALVRWLLQRGIGKTIRYDGPASHQVKAGTATMGGLYFLVGATLVALVSWLGGQGGVAWLPWLAMVLFAGLGAFDDLQGLKDRSGVGWLAGIKFVAQWGVALLVAAVLVAAQPDLPTRWPGGATTHLGWWAVPLTMLLLVGTSNAANMTDGLDGLTGGLAAIAYACLGALTLTSQQGALAGFCFGVAGSLGAFLWFNVHPARLFMGDTGSQALGAGLAVVAVLGGYWWLLPLIGLLFYLDLFSVMVQVSYFKYTRKRYGEGRRVFKMAPWHHHLELCGWSEVQITARFWVLGVLCAVVALCIGVGA